MDANDYPRTRGWRWQDDATCAVEKIPMAVFFIEPGGDPRPAREACARCPVRQQCLDDEMNTEHPYGLMHGTRGGLTANERMKLRAKTNGLKRQPATPADCGTDAGYQRHRRLGTPACPACLDAHRQATYIWHQRQRGVAS